eukprot:CAMPEP_0197022940 /NCGR_PEP_ID=MMETSP1384-20130603/3727_1 /TAXON_ID=29189 /ORGANISM="Ammonia sp." /LENGTH=257 /DNA_ID=CAMNT_0042451067 /DNA_START=82 /DNA_END=855 /DNA_ORIENTATION=+
MAMQDDTITVSMMAGMRHVAVRVPSTWTVNALKQRYCDQEVGHNKELTLMFRAKKLRDDATLKSCGIRAGAVILVIGKAFGGGGQDPMITVGVLMKGKRIAFKVRSSATVQDLKQLICDRELGHHANITLYCHAKNLPNNVTLDSCGIRDGSLITMTHRLNGGGGGGGGAASDVWHSEWTVMHSTCPVCRAKNVANLVPGYWYHPGGNKAEWKQEKPGTGYTVECKQNKIRCSDCKNESDAKDWVYKCPNHDHQKMS